MSKLSEQLGGTRRGAWVVGLTVALVLTQLGLVPTPASAVLPVLTPLGYREIPAPRFLGDITAGPDGNVWATNREGTIVRITPAGVVSEFPVANPNAGPSQITGGPDGRVWFTEDNAPQIGRITPAGAIKEFGLPHQAQRPRAFDIVAGPDGNVWFSVRYLDGGAPVIESITPTGRITEIPLPAGVEAGFLTSGPGGKVWFTGTDATFAPVVGSVAPDGRVTIFALPPGTIQAYAITAGPDGNLWFGTRNNTVDRMTPTGVVTEFLIPPNSPDESGNVYNAISDITVGSDGALWYTRGNHIIGRITPTGVVGQFTLADRTPSSITTGPDGALWFTTGESVVGTFAPFALPPVPAQVLGVSPASGRPRGGAKVTISGVNLQNVTGVTFGGAPATSFTVVDAGHIVAVAPSHAVGAADVIVTTPSGASSPDPAAQFFYNSPTCGKVVTASTTLTKNIGPCYDDGVIIGADNVTLDLGGKRIFGFDGPSGGNSAGVRLPNRTGVTVRNGAITGFDGGVVVNQGRANILSGLNIHDNIGPDNPDSTLGDGVVLFNAANNTIANDTIAHNGHYDGIGCLGASCNGNAIHDNLVENNLGPASGVAGGEGIIITNYLDVNDGAAITHNDVMNNTVRGNGAAGISNINNTYSLIRHNLVEGNGLTNQIGNGIGVSVGPQPKQPDTHMTVEDNTVTHNGESGIVDAYGALSNTFTSNISTDNNVRGFGRPRDLKDENADCDANVWTNNTWGSAGYDPPCVTTGGSGPNPPAASAVAPAVAAAATKPGGAPTPLLRKSPPG